MSYPEDVKGVSAHFEAPFVDPIEELPEDPVTRLWHIDIELLKAHSGLRVHRLIVEYDRRDDLELDSLLENRGASESAMVVFEAPA